MCFKFQRESFNKNKVIAKVITPTTLPLMTPGWWQYLILLSLKNRQANKETIKNMVNKRHKMDLQHLPHHSHHHIIQVLQKVGQKMWPLVCIFYCPFHLCLSSKFSRYLPYFWSDFFHTCTSFLKFLDAIVDQISLGSDNG